jgi:hypothetical protein
MKDKKDTLKKNTQICVGQSDVQNEMNPECKFSVVKLLCERINGMPLPPTLQTREKATRRNDL